MAFIQSKTIRINLKNFTKLFARRRTPGWDVWGNEIDSDIVIPGYPVPKYSIKVTGTENTEGV